MLFIYLYQILYITVKENLKKFPSAQKYVITVSQKTALKGVLTDLSTISAYFRWFWYMPGIAEKSRFFAYNRD